MSHPSQPGPGPAKLPSVFVVGDSISIQYGPYLEKYLDGFFHYARKSGESAALANLDIPEGANGGDSSMVLKYLRARFEGGDFRPGLLLVNCGLHDIKTGREDKKIQIPLADYRRNLEGIASLAREGKVPLGWVRTTHSADAIHNTKASFLRFAADNDRYDEAACEIMAGAGAPVVDLRRFTRNLGPDDGLFCDHVHFHPPVREKQGAFIAGWLTAWKAA